jgi:E3 ubiquitin-protein ligase SIAH1
MAPGSSIVTVVPESDCGDDDGLSEALGGIRLDVDSASKPWSTSLANVALSSLSGLNDLLECPVCTNSMRPPILQVCVLRLTFYFVGKRRWFGNWSMHLCLFEFVCKENAVSLHCLLDV